MSDINEGGAPVASEAPVSDNTEATLDTQEGIEGEEATLAPAEKKAIEKQLKKYKLKVDGEEFEEELDLNNEEEVKKRLQLARAAQKRMQETASERKKNQDFEKSAQEFFQLLKSNPRAILTDPSIGIDLKKFAQEIINEEMEQAKKSPEQREIERLQKELGDREKTAKDADEKRQAAEFQKLQEQATVQLDTDITEACKAAGLPKKPYVLKKFVDLMTMAVENDIPLTAKDLGPLVKRQIIEDIQEMTAAAGDDDIEDLIGKDIMTRMRKRSLAKAKTVPGAGGVRATAASANTKVDEPSKKIAMRDFFKL
jgi:hypothetical protein